MHRLPAMPLPAAGRIRAASPGSPADASAAIPTDDLLLYALSLLPLTAALLFALLYRRRPRKQ